MFFTFFLQFRSGAKKILRWLARSPTPPLAPPPLSPTHSPLAAPPRPSPPLTAPHRPPAPRRPSTPLAAPPPLPPSMIASPPPSRTTSAQTPSPQSWYRDVTEHHSPIRLSGTLPLGIDIDATDPRICPYLQSALAILCLTPGDLPPNPADIMELVSRMRQRLLPQCQETVPQVNAAYHLIMRAATAAQSSGTNMLRYHLEDPRSPPFRGWICAEMSSPNNKVRCDYCGMHIEGALVKIGILEKEEEGRKWMHAECFPWPAEILSRFPPNSSSFVIAHMARAGALDFIQGYQSLPSWCKIQLQDSIANVENFQV